VLIQGFVSIFFIKTFNLILRQENVKLNHKEFELTQNPSNIYEYKETGREEDDCTIYTGST